MDWKSALLSKTLTAHPFRKIVLRGFLIGLLFLLFLEFVVYFGSNLFLSGIVRDKLNTATNGVYEIGFNRLNLSLIRRGLVLNGIIMKPVHPENAESDQFLFQITIDEIFLSGLWLDPWKKEFSISKINIDNPNLRLFNTETNTNGDAKKVLSTEQSSSIKLLENELKKSLKKLNLNELYVGQIEIEHANFFFFNFLSRGELKAKNTSILINGLDWTTTEEWKTPFNAKGIEFELEDATFPLPDGIHVLSAELANLSSQKKTIDIRRFSLIPNLNIETDTYYQLNLDRLRIGNADLNKAFMTSQLEMDELIMDKPSIRVIKSDLIKEERTSSGNLNNLIQGKLKELSIKELSINGASFVKTHLNDSLKNRIELGNLDFKMVGFYLGQDSLQNQNQFFYGKDASMEISGGKLYLGDGLHILEGNKVNVSSFKDELLVSGLSLSPNPNGSSGSSPKNLIKIDLPEFSLYEADLKRLYQTGQLKVDQVLINQPNIEFTELVANEENTSKFPFSEVISGFLDSVSVRDFQVNDGKVFFKDVKGQKSNNIGFEKFSLKLDQLDVLPDRKLHIQDQFKIGQIFLTLDKYRLKLEDNLHLIFADQLSIDSRRNLLEVVNLSIKPQNQDQISSLLEIYGKTSALELSVPLFRATGLDVKEAFFNQNLKIREILLPEPTFFVSTYKAKEKNEKEVSINSSQDIKNLLLGYFNKIDIDSISLTKAKVRYENYVENKKSRFEENDLSLKLKNFSIGNSDSLDLSRSLFSDEVNLTLNNYSFSLAGGRYLAETDFLNYNSRTKSIEMNRLMLSPGAGISNRISLELNFPRVKLLGVDLEDFIFEGYLNLQKLEVEKGEIEIEIDKKQRAVAVSRRNRRLRKAVDEVKIDTIQANNSILRLNYLGQNQSQQSIRTGFDLLITEFSLDSLMVSAEDFSGSYSAANLDLKDFEFALPDSIHTVKFSSLSLGDKKDELILSDFNIIPKDHFGRNGNPAIEAKIDQLILQKNKLQDMLHTKILYLNEVRLNNPSVDIYLDSSKTSSSQKLPRERKENSLIESVILKDLNLDNGSIRVHKNNQGLIPALNFPNLDLMLADLGIDLLNSKQLPELSDLAKKKFTFSLSGYEYLTPDSMYRARFDNINLEEGNLAIKNIRIQPERGIYNYLRNQKFQTDAVVTQVDHLLLRGLDPLKFIEDDLIKADEVLVDGANVDLFRDKRIPLDTLSYRPMPQFLMENSSFNADILSVRIRDSRIRYFEFPEKGLMPGMISFDSVQVDLAPFFMRKKGIVYPLEKVRLGLQANLMGTSKLKLEGLFYFQKGYPMDLKVEMNGFDFRQASDFLSKTSFINAVSGEITTSRWEFHLNEEFALGEMELGYKDLKIQFLDSLTLEPGRGKLKLFNFGSNLLAKNANPRTTSGNLVKRKIYIKRDKRKFVFNTWWKASFSGIKATLGFGKAKLPKEMRKEKRKVD